jgi:cytochrome bd-type quinol oxidase subunit 2
MSSADSPARIRALRRYLARGVIIVYFFVVVTIALTIFGKNGDAIGHGLRWGVLVLAFAPLTGGFIGAVRVLGAADRGRSARLAFWSAGLLLLGLAILVGSTVTG